MISPIRGLQALFNKEADKIYLLLADIDVELTVSSETRDSILNKLEKWNPEETLKILASFALIYNLKQVNKLISKSVSKVDPSISNADIRAFIKDLDNKAKKELLDYTSKVNILDIRNKLGNAIANKIVNSGSLSEALSKKEFRKSLDYAIGYDLPIIINNGYKTISESIVLSNEWVVNRPLDYPCYSVKGEIRKIGEKFSNGFYSPPVHFSCYCGLKPYSLSKSNIRKIKGYGKR